MNVDKKQYQKNIAANKRRKEKLSPTEQPRLRSEVFDDSLKIAFDECVERGKKASEINQDRANEELHI